MIENERLIAEIRHLKDRVAQLEATNYSLTATDMLAAIKTVDGAGSGLDADLLGGLSSAAFPQITAATWTPVLRFNGLTTGITYIAQAAKYIKIGSLIFVDVTIALSSSGTATGAASISGLPFTATASGGIVARYIAGMPALTLPITGYFSGTSIVPQQNLSTALTDANFTNSSNFQVLGFYEG